jgi:RNA polymerase sigma-70 factor (ECF subfamily)
MSTEEARWIAQARDGDRLAFRRLVDAHARPLYALCVRITRDPATAEDAVQETLFNAWRHLRDFDGRALFSTWLHRIAVNEALQQLRRRWRHESGEVRDEEGASPFDHVAAETPGPEREARSAALGRTIERKLEAMSELERTAFVLKHCEGESLQEIADTLSISVSASKQAVFRAVRKLRGALEPIGEVP